MAPRSDESPSDNGVQAKTSSDQRQRTSTMERIKKAWAKTGIDVRTAKMMVKGSLAPTIVLAAGQSSTWAGFYTTLGYLVGIISILTITFKPRANFIQFLLMDLLLGCFGIAVAILAMYCCVRARATSGEANSTGQTSGLAAGGAPTAPYNGAASAVAGVWLFMQIYVIGVLRANLPQYNVPCILWAIVANVSLNYAPQFSQMTEALAFAEKFLLAYLTAFAVGTGVSLFIFPTTCRGSVFGTMASYITTFRSALEAQMTYLHSLEDTDMFAAQKTNTQGEKPPRSPEAEAFRARTRELATIYSKLAADLPFAKREIAWGKIGPTEIQQVFNMLRLSLVSMTGLSYVSDIFERISHDNGWDSSDDFAHADVSRAQDEAQRARIETINEWHELIHQLKKPFASVVESIDEGLQHVLIVLELAPKTKSRRTDDDEGKAGRPLPGDKDFADYLDRRSKDFLESKKLMLRTWCGVHGIELADDFFENPSQNYYHLPEWMKRGKITDQRRRILRRQLSLMLYIEYSLFYVSRRTYELVQCVDRIKASGKLDRNHIIVPGVKRLRKWVFEAFFRSQDTSNQHDLNEERQPTVQLGSAYKNKDPEHLPPETTWERLSNHLRAIPHFLSSPASSFGFRLAVATMSVAIFAYVQETQIWATRQRTFWAQIMVSIGMQPTAGNTLQAYVLRVLGTVLAMLVSWIAWYIVDSHTAGIIVFFFILILPGPWIILKHPRFTAVGMVYPITMTLIIGYELQERKLGIQVVESNGQEYYPVYILGLVRLATVVVGLTVAWIFTIFPFPISEHSKLRKSLGVSLQLLANYYSVLHETVRLRLAGSGGDTGVKGSPAHKLEKARLKLFAKANGILSGLKAQADATKLDIPIGGKFPREQYDFLIDRLRNLLHYMTIVGIASGNFSKLLEDVDDHGSEWLLNFRRINNEANVTSEAVTAMLVVLASCISSGTPLPPYLRVPEPYGLAQRMDEIDADLLSIRHLAEPGYATFAVVLIGSKCITDDLKDMLDSVRKLVGELDFSYKILDDEKAPQQDGEEETLVYRRTISRTERDKNE